jgi:hypothetical protein
LKEGALIVSLDPSVAAGDRVVTECNLDDISAILDVAVHDYRSMDVSWDCSVRGVPPTYAGPPGTLDPVCAEPPSVACLWDRARESVEDKAVDISQVKKKEQGLSWGG